MFRPDPASLLWDRAAARFLARVREAHGAWHAGPVGDPTPRVRAYLAEAIGTPWNAPDPQPGRKAKDRWRRAFIRALERQRKAAGLVIEWQVGRRIRSASGKRARPVRARLLPPGGAQAAARRKRASQRIYDYQGGQIVPGARWADPDLRDWPQ